MDVFRADVLLLNSLRSKQCFSATNPHELCGTTPEATDEVVK